VNWGNQLTAMMKVREKRQRHGSELGQPAHCDGAHSVREKTQHSDDESEGEETKARQ
jgi:hypothetical protein